VKAAAKIARHALPPLSTVPYVVKFGQRPRRTSRREQDAPCGRVPRVARLLALAHNIDGMIRSGELRDWAHAAQLAGVTRARMTQIANLLLLSPRIQGSILNLSKVVEGRESVTEHLLRRATDLPDWQEQEVHLLTIARTFSPTHRHPVSQ